MAKRLYNTRRKQETDKPKYFCRDCKHSYDWHSKALDGHLILCRCPLDKKTENGRWCKFLSDPMCEHFEIREDAKVEQVGD